MLLSEAVRDLARDRPRRSVVLIAAVAILAVAALTSSASSPSDKKSSVVESSGKVTPPSSASALCASPSSSSSSPKNKMGLLGAPTAGNPEESRHAAEFAVQQLQANAAFPKNGALALARLVSAQRQVVAGTNHILVFETKDASGALKTVHATVWEKLPDHARNGARDMELTKFAIDGGAPAAEGVECGGPAVASSSWQDAAARAAVAGINARSNSLVPYELSAVLEAKPAGSPGGASELRLRLKRGDKSETFRVSVKEKEKGVGATAAGGAGGYGLVSFAHEP